MQWDDDDRRWDDPIGSPQWRMSPEHARRFWKAFAVILVIVLAADVWASFL
jgi:hypothetical protein